MTIFGSAGLPESAVVGAQTQIKLKRMSVVMFG